VRARQAPRPAAGIPVAPRLTAVRAATRSALPHVLVVDDDEDTRNALAEFVGDQGYTVALAADLREARIQLVRQQPDLLLADLRLPDGDGMELLPELGSDARVILITGNATVESAVAALRAGAADYLVKPVNLQRLQDILAQLPRPADAGPAPELADEPGRYGQLLGASPVMQQLYDHIARVAPTEATVLLAGESGTGKELVAQSIHDRSRRRRMPFLAVNCGAISPNLIESEMFGHERGSFTGAERQHKGYFERADGGTLFLDEITEMPVELQVKLLRVLETGRFMRIGTDREVETDVRVLAATSRDPEAAVADGKLRADLFHRLNVFPLAMPPLRERGEDIAMLAQHFLDEMNRVHGTQKLFSPATLQQLVLHRWPGNVRELRNYVQRAYILSDEAIDATALPLGLSPAGDGSGPTLEIPVGTSLAEADKRLILATLEQCGGVKKHSAELLGISLKTLYNRLDEYGLQRPSAEPLPERLAER